MRGPRYEYILASTALALILAAPLGGGARDLDVVVGKSATQLAAAPIAATPAQWASTPPPAVAPAPPAAVAPVPADERQLSPAGTADPTPGIDQTAAPDPLASLSPADRAVAEKIRDLLATKADRIFSNKKERDAAEAFYQNRNLKPLWLDQGVENARARAAIARLKNADGDGLDASEYKAPDFAGLDPDGLAEAELKLTRTVLTYARHVQAGRFPYTRVSRNIELPQAPPDPAEILKSVAEAPDAGKALDAYSPRQEPYQKLKAALAELRSRPGSAKGEVARQIETVIANMERWRWYPRDLGAAHVLVNQPDFTLKVMHNGAQVWTTRVVIGKTSKPTPLLSETMKYLTVNPTWHVPPSIVHNEYLPALAQDPTVLSRMGLNVSYHGGDVEITMPPGDNNALGRIRFSFPNRFLVYQHDTPDKYMFAHEVRAESHGCMRVQDPPKYAEVLLNIARPGEHWTAERIRGMYGRSEQDIHLEQAQIWVHLTYQTAFVDNAGKLQMRRDIYNLDGRTVAAIKRERGVVEPAQERRDEQIAASSSGTRKVARTSHSASSPFQSTFYDTPSYPPAYAPTYGRPFPPRVIYR
ncbi:MAG TPA: L,D-transpeptidase family protein [Xanthobacteraceae bacterium]|jgi:murein L,D-transpeptidase YcbB/YkuD